MDKLDKILKGLKSILAPDTETTGLGPKDIPFCVGLYDQMGNTEFYRWKIKSKKNIVIPNKVKETMMDEKIAKVFHNEAFDRRMLRNVGVEVEGPTYDTFIMAHTLLPARRSYSLKTLVPELLGELGFSYTDDFDVKKYVKKHKCGFDDIPKEKLKTYCLGDCQNTLMLFFLLLDALDMPVYKIESALIPVIMKMEKAGFRINVPKAKKELKKTGIKIEVYKKMFKKKYGIDNPNSPKQLSEAIYDRLGLDSPHPKGKKDRSTNFLALTLLNRRGDSRLPQRILDYRKHETNRKFLAQFVEKSYKKGRNYFIYPRFNPLGNMDKGIPTGRFSSSNPSFQNITRGPELRRLILPRKGFILADYDYSQIEMRLYAVYSEDEIMMQAYHTGVDVHVLHKKEFVDPHLKMDDFKEARRIAKHIGFEIIYGIGAAGMQAYLQKQAVFLDIKVVEAMMDTWYQNHPSLRRLKLQLFGELRSKGYVTDPLGRRYWVPMHKSYVVINYYIQGMAANIIKLAMVDVHKYLNTVGGRIIMTIHDELIVEVKDGPAAQDQMEYVKFLMEDVGNRIPLPINLEVEYGQSTRNWAEAAH